MRLEIKKLAELRARLEAVRPAEILATALAAEADRLAQSVRDGLATVPGAGDHERPWSQTGALHDSITASAEGLNASIGSNDPAAAPQEMGTIHLPPRPFLAPVAATQGAQIARTIAETVSRSLQAGETPMI